MLSKHRTTSSQNRHLTGKFLPAAAAAGAAAVDISCKGISAPTDVPVYLMRIWYLVEVFNFVLWFFVSFKFVEFV